MPSFVCPYCSFTRSWKLRRNKHKCKQCRRESSGIQYPVPQIRASPAEWRMCIDLFLRERTAIRVETELMIAKTTAQHMTHLLRQCMAEDMPKVLPGPVEMDETYIGGQRKNKRLHIRRIQGKRGHGTDKLPIVGVVSRTTGMVYTEVLPQKLDIRRITAILEERVPYGSLVYTDGFKMYRGLKRHGYAPRMWTTRAVNTFVA